MILVLVQVACYVMHGLRYVWTRFSSVFNVNGVGSRTQSAKNRDGVLVETSVFIT
jgi:hypothetical protein